MLLIDGAGRLLLLRGFDPANPRHRYWFTIGGGLDEGETARQAAVRELAEETGLVVDPGELTGPVYRDVAEFPFDHRWYRQEQDFYLARVPSWQVDTTGFNEIERASVDGHRWWTADELAATAEPYYPERLPDLLRSVLKDDDLKDDDLEDDLER